MKKLIAISFALFLLPLAAQDEKKDSQKFNDKVDNFLRFSMDNFDTELVVMGIKLALTQYGLPIARTSLYNDRF
jgi:hypothetical protein